MSYNLRLDSKPAGQLERLILLAEKEGKTQITFSERSTRSWRKA